MPKQKWNDLLGEKTAAGKREWTLRFFFGLDAYQRRVGVVLVCGCCAEGNV
jgi:hypothetical protein